MCERNGYIQACSYFCIATRNILLKIVNKILIDFYFITFSFQMQTTYNFTFFRLDYDIV
jgi:hypothetical protein